MAERNIRYRTAEDGARIAYCVQGESWGIGPWRDIGWRG